MMSSVTKKVDTHLLLFLTVVNMLAVIHQCALTRDLSLFEAGDATEVGEKGLTLRCVYDASEFLNTITDLYVTYPISVEAKK